MSLEWSREQSPVWDDDKQRIIGGAPAGALDLSYPAGEQLPGDWYTASEDGRVVGYGWMDSTWGGDTEILMAVDPDHQGRGIGTFVMNHLEWEAAQRGFNYVYNTVRDSHPDRDTVHDWLLVRGYRGNERDASLRKRVSLPDSDAGADGSDSRRSTTRGGTQPSAGPQPELSSFPPGREESGGYVNQEQHQY
jgi:GNAT superfamily N-acetyltransferase